MLAFSQPGKVLRADRSFKPPLLRQPALPLIMAPLVTALVVRLLGRKLAGVVRSCLAAGEGF